VTLELPEFYSLHHLPQVESTNATAKQFALDGAPEGTLIFADMQTRGRGRSGRDWISPRGNLYMSLLLRPKESPAVVAQLSFAVALSVFDLIAPYLPDHDLRLKWPNDVLVDGRKISGILLESSATPDAKLAWLIIGVGINVANVPDAVANTGTCLHDLGSRDIDAEICLAGFAGHLWRWLTVWREQGFGPVRTAWLERCGALGQTLRVRVGREQFDGKFENLDDDGALILQLPDGGARRVTAGEVFFAEQ
jgi:BirA family biotin operon repressor/biotin-[acetyl-CoA-carboxylase] ligase